MNKKIETIALALSVLLFSISKYLIDDGVETLPETLQLIAYTTVPVAGGLIILSFCSLLGAFTDAKNLVTSHIMRRISEDPVRNFFVGFLVTAYLNLIRPSLAANVSYLPYVEWVAAALSVYCMYSIAKPLTEEFHFDSEDPHWKRHTQEVKREMGLSLMRITSAMEQFVDDGVKEPLLVHLTLHLQRLGQTEEEILKTLSPIIDHQESALSRKLYLWAFRWRKRKHAIKDKEVRENLLNTLMNRINGSR